MIAAALPPAERCAGLGGREIIRFGPGLPAFALTVDVEDWFHANWRSAPPLDSARLPRRVEESVDCVLATLDATGARATCFVLGCVAREHPTIVPRLARAGHEVACHGMTHTLVYEQTPEAFRADVGDARKLLADQSGQPVWGFRAPSWSVTSRSLWALDVLAECGFRYDSSIFAAANYLYGIDGAPRTPYAVRTAAGGLLVEMPPPLVGAGPVRVGVGGGFYLRILPLWVHRWALAGAARRGFPFMLYVHPRELDPGAWRFRLRLSPKEAMIHRLRLRAVPRRFRRLLAGRTWVPLADVLRSSGMLA